MATIPKNPTEAEKFAIFTKLNNFMNEKPRYGIRRDEYSSGYLVVDRIAAKVQNKVYRTAADAEVEVGILSNGESQSLRRNLDAYFDGKLDPMKAQLFESILTASLDGINADGGVAPVRVDPATARAINEMKAKQQGYMQDSRNADLAPFLAELRAQLKAAGLGEVGVKVMNLDEGAAPESCDHSAIAHDAIKSLREYAKVLRNQYASPALVADDMDDEAAILEARLSEI